MNTIVKILTLIGIGSLLACGSKQEVKVPESDASSNGAIVLNLEQIKRAGIQTGKIEKVLLSHDVHARGKIAVPPQNKATVSAVMPGIIKSIKVSPGQKIKVGQVLATYSHPDFIILQQEYLDNLNQFEFLKKDYERQKQLRDRNINSEKEFQAVESNYRKAMAAMESGKAQLKLLNIDIENLKEGNILSEIRILSPISGVINDISANIGMSVEAGTTLFEILDTRKLVLMVKVFEKDMHLLKIGQRITFSTSGDEEEISEAWVNSIGAMVDDESRTIDVLANIEDPRPDMIPGMFVSSEIHTSEEMLEALPERAIVIENDNETYGFYTLDDPEKNQASFYKFNVKTGFAEDGFVQVTPVLPLPDNAMIVIDGVYYIKSEMMKMLE